MLGWLGLVCILSTLYVYLQFKTVINRARNYMQMRVLLQFTWNCVDFHYQSSTFFFLFERECQKKKSWYWKQTVIAQVDGLILFHLTYNEFWLKYLSEKKILDIEIIGSENVFDVWFHIRLWVCFFKNELHKKQIQIPIHQRTHERDNEVNVHKSYFKFQTAGWEQDLSFFSLM